MTFADFIQAAPPSAYLDGLEATWSLTIYGHAGIPTVRIGADGKVTLGPGVTPDEAARAFWDAVERIGGERLEEARREHGG